MELSFRLDKTAKGNSMVMGRYCNLACIWCHHDYFEHNGFTAISNDMFIEGLKRVIRVTSADQVNVRISGDGEPTIVGGDELADLIKKLKHIPQVCKVKLTTNGLLLDKVIPDLLRSGIDTITVSLNSLNREKYKQYSRFDGLETVLENIDLAQTAGLRMKVNTIYSMINEDEIKDFEEFSCKYNGMHIKFFDLLIFGPEEQNIYLPLSKWFSR